MAYRSAYTAEFLDMAHPGWGSTNEWHMNPAYTQVFDNNEIVTHYQHWRDKFEPESNEYMLRQILSNQNRIMSHLGLDNP